MLSEIRIITVTEEQAGESSSSVFCFSFPLGRKNSAQAQGIGWEDQSELDLIEAGLVG